MVLARAKRNVARGCKDDDNLDGNIDIVGRSVCRDEL